MTTMQKEDDLSPQVSAPGVTVRSHFFREVPELTFPKMLLLILFAFSMPPLFFGFMGYKGFSPNTYKPWLKLIVRGLAISLLAPLASFLFMLKGVNFLIVFWAMVAPAVAFIMGCLLSVGVGYALAHYQHKQRGIQLAVEAT